VIRGLEWLARFAAAPSEDIAEAIVFYLRRDRHLPPGAKTLNLHTARVLRGYYRTAVKREKQAAAQAKAARKATRRRR
jgi:hypothetical protein